VLTHTHHDTVTREDAEASLLYRVLRRLLDAGDVDPAETFLFVFAGALEARVVDALSLRNATISNISTAESVHGATLVNAACLPFPDEGYDHVIAHAGIHHASRPHQVLCEMYRVTRRTAMFFESQDSALVRLAVWFGLISEFEWNGILDSGGTRGGVDDRPVPNYVYRWTRREVEKLVRSLDPAREPSLAYVTEWNFYYRRLARRLARTPLGKLPPSVLDAACRAAVQTANGLFGRQGNAFAAIIRKASARPQPWMRERPEGLVFDIGSIELGRLGQRRPAGHDHRAAFTLR
jgi:SAM-dependent methyltransferase